jgi:hypothetical protein
MNSKFWQANKNIPDVAMKSWMSYDQILTKNNVKELLVLGYSPLIAVLSEKYKINVVCDKIFQPLLPKCTIYEEINDVQRTYECVLAPDEWFTYYATEDQQKEALSQARDRTSSLLITTLQDYKNNLPQKIQSQILSDVNGVTVVQKNVINVKDSQQWKQWYYMLDARAQMFGPVLRRTLYFKQFARYCKDLDCQEFTIDKSIIWTGNFYKTHEHWIIVRF